MIPTFISPSLPLTSQHPLPSTSTSAPRRHNPSPTLSLSVLVAGAAGRTGRLVLSTLLSQPDTFSAHGIVRSISRASQLPDPPPPEALHEADITQRDSLVEPLRNVDALVILTSAVPKIKPDSKQGEPPTFYYQAGGEPEVVDWHGAKNQIDVAIQHGVKHIVMVGSMGSTDDNNPLNRIANGNILRFKRKAELYLIESGVDYTIVNPAGLVDHPGGERQLLCGRNDEFFTMFDRKDMSIPRADVARVVTAALTEKDARNKAFDLCARPVGMGEVTTNLVELFCSAGPSL